MDNEHRDQVTARATRVYNWNNKQDGKDEYTEFASEWEIGVKQYRYLLDPAAVERTRGENPGPAPVGANARREWREDKNQYDRRVRKIEEHFMAALSLLASSFAKSTSPRHIINKAIERPADVPAEEWTFERKFRAAWEALRLEYQPSTAVDLSQLREQIFALNDQMPGGFDAFKSEFHRLHTEIMATQIPDAITARELNGIVREGIKNPIVWGFIGHDIYKATGEAPWQTTFEAVSQFLTSFRKKGVDPYDSAQGGLIIGNIPVTANNVLALSAERSAPGQKRPSPPTRDSVERFRKAPKTFTSDFSSQGKFKTSHHQQSTSKHDSSTLRADRRCTRCWQITSHSYRDCTETKCLCGSNLSQGQSICFNYDNHPANAKFSEDRMPKALEKILDAYRRGKGTAVMNTNPNATSTPKPKGSHNKRKGNRNIKAMAASVAEELIRRGITGDNLDRSSA